MLFVRMGKTLFRGIVLGESSIMDACISTKVSHLNEWSPFISAAHTSINSELLELESGVFY